MHQGNKTGDLISLESGLSNLNFLCHNFLYWSKFRRNLEKFRLQSWFYIYWPANLPKRSFFIDLFRQVKHILWRFLNFYLLNPFRQNLKVCFLQKLDCTIKSNSQIGKEKMKMLRSEHTSHQLLPQKRKIFQTESYVNKSTMYIIFVHFVILLYEIF